MIPALHMNALRRNLGLQHLRHALPSAFAVYHLQDAARSEGPPVSVVQKGRSKNQRVIMMLRLLQPIAAVTDGKRQGSSR